MNEHTIDMLIEKNVELAFEYLNNIHETETETETDNYNYSDGDTRRIMDLVEEYDNS